MDGKLKKAMKGRTERGEERRPGEILTRRKETYEKERDEERGKMR